MNMRVLFCCVILFPCLLYSAGYVNYEQLTNKGNIINQSVFNIVKDRKGFVWIASKTGISRYDGFNYKKYALSLMGEIPNENSRQTGIYTGDDNRLWAYNDRGNIYFYDPYSDTFIFYVSIREISDNAFWLSDIYWHNNRLWMATSNSLLSFGIVEREKKTKKYFDGLAVNKIIAINDSVLAAGTTAGLVFVNTSRETGGEEIVCKDHHITSLFYDNLNHQLWIGTFNSGLFIWDTQKKTFLPDNFTKQISLNPIRVVKQLDNDNLLIGSDGSGIYKIDRTKKTIELFLSDKYNGNRQLAGNGVYDILIDDKSIWVGIYYGGLTILRGYDDLDRIYHIPHDKESLIDGHVNAILEDSNGNMWYACNSGISMQEVKTKKWTHFFEKQNSFLSLMEDNRGQIWCGGYNTGVYCIDKNKKIIRHIKSFQNKEEMDCIYASAIDKDGDLWFGGLYNPLTRISHENGQEKFTFYDIMQVRNIVPLNRDTLFVATSIGYCLLNKQTGKFDRHVGAVIKNDPYSNSYVYSGILLDNNLWFGTDGGGLNCFNLTTRNISNYSDISGGLPSNCIYGILTDRENTFWISADNGLFNFDPQTQKVLSSIADLPEKGFVPMSYTQLKDGRMAFGSRNGAIIFNPEKIKHNQKKSNFHFTDFRISYKSVTSKDDPRVLPVPVDEISHITLSHNQNTFAFDFISIDLYDPNNYLYDYKLEGFNQEWIPQSNTQTASYTNIPPGKYRFIVRCFSSAGKEILDERIISITILPPFYNTVWAWLVYFLLLCGIIYWIYIYFKERLQQRQSNEKINFFINVAHDIRTPLSLVMAPLKDMEKESGLSESAQNSLHLANKNGTKLLSIVNQLLDFQKEAILPSLLDLTVCDFKAYLTERVESFKPYADTKNIHIHTDIPVESIVLEIDVNKMDRILDNLLSNAVKYTQNGGDIFIRLSKKKNRMELAVRDTGIGISKKEARKIFHHFFRAENAVNSKETGSGIGLVLTKKLVKQMNGKLSFASIKDKGTTFFLSIPVGGQHLKTMNRPTEPAKKTMQEIYFKKVKPLKTFYRLLLVEDNDDMRNYLENKLSCEYRVFAVSSAEEALAFLKENRVDIVVSDIMMEGMNGDELCRILKSNIETSHLIVILLTALSDKARILKGLETGADDYITKPFDMEILTAKIRNFLLARTKLQEFYLTNIKLQDIQDSNNYIKENRPDTNELNDQFLKKCVQIVSKNMANSDFTVNDLYRELAMSKTIVFDKLKALTNQGPNDFIRIIRLKYAKELLESKQYTIPEVADRSGFSDAKYFSTVFKKFYGFSPSNIKN